MPNMQSSSPLKIVYEGGKQKEGDKLENRRKKCSPLRRVCVGGSVSYSPFVASQEKTSWFNPNRMPLLTVL